MLHAGMRLQDFLMTPDIMLILWLLCCRLVFSGSPLPLLGVRSTIHFILNPTAGCRQVRAAIVVSFCQACPEPSATHLAETISAALSAAAAAVLIACDQPEMLSKASLPTVSIPVCGDLMRLGTHVEADTCDRSL